MTSGAVRREACWGLSWGLGSGPLRKARVFHTSPTGLPTLSLSWESHPSNWEATAHRHGLDTGTNMCPHKSPQKRAPRCPPPRPEPRVLPGRPERFPPGTRHPHDLGLRARKGSTEARGGPDAHPRQTPNKVPSPEVHRPDARAPTHLQGQTAGRCRSLSQRPPHLTPSIPPSLMLPHTKARVFAIATLGKNLLSSPMPGFALLAA